MCPLSSLSSEDDEDEEEVEEELKDRDRPRWELWLNVESSREATHWLPWRPEKGQTVEDCEDPDRQVIGAELKMHHKRFYVNVKKIIKCSNIIVPILFSLNTSDVEN